MPSPCWLCFSVARFLELDSLSHKCEDLLVDSISLDNIISLIKWAKESHGSNYVYRNCIVYLREDFSSFSSSPGFYELDRHTFCELISSDFVQVQGKPNSASNSCKWNWRIFGTNFIFIPRPLSQIFSSPWYVGERSNLKELMQEVSHCHLPINFH